MEAFSDLNQFAIALKQNFVRSVASINGLRGEIKWSAVTTRNIDTYRRLSDVFFQEIAENDLTYRQVFLDRSYVRVPNPEDTSTPTALDTQFRICYQFLKHGFGLRYLAMENLFDEYTITIRIDNHSSQKHTESLSSFAQNLGTVLGVPQLITRVRFVDSKKFLRLQLCDLLMGAAGSHGNKMHLRREVGQRGMTEKQKCRFGMATYIYDCLRQLNAGQRGSKAFNWFESTGTDGAPKNRLNHKLRIWKFVPKRYQIDKGWQNDNLDNQGRYQGAQLETQIRSDDPLSPFPTFD